MRPGAGAALGKWVALMALALAVTAVSAVARAVRWVRDTLTGARR